MIDDVLDRLGLRDQLGEASPSAGLLVSINPSTEAPLGAVPIASADDYEAILARAQESFSRWRLTPAPYRGELVRRFGLALRERKSDLAMLVTLESGKVLSESVGEVQEMIDMCDLAVGLSRQVGGLTLPSERPNHRMMEQWHPLGLVGVITAFNFPVAVWAWNAMLAAIGGNVTIWKPSPETPLGALAVQRIVSEVFGAEGWADVFSVCVGEASIGAVMADDRRLPLISATGSCAMGRSVGQRVARRLGRALLELGGNNAAIVTESANLDLALRAVAFAALGAAGQRCTTLRRLIVHESIATMFVERLVAVFGGVRVGDPWDDGVLMGPLINERAVAGMARALDDAREQGGELLIGGGRLPRAGWFVPPTIVRARPEMPIVRQETFAPILYVMTYRTLDEAIAINNAVDQGLSSAIFTERIRESERFLSAAGSDCGIANVNIGTSGAEIGGAFGGEKDTGGGREAGADAWKAYMRRQTCVIHFGDDLPLAQGVRFDIDARSDP